MERKNSILTNFKSIDYEGLKLEQSLIDFSDISEPKLDSEGYINFDNIYFGIISLN